MVPRDFVHPHFEDPVAGAMSYEFQVQMGAKELAPAPALALGPILSTPPAPAPANETYVIEVDATKEEVFASQGILLQIFMLATAFIVGHILRRRRFYYLHEASAALLIGELRIGTCAQGGAFRSNQALAPCLLLVTEQAHPARLKEGRLSRSEV